MNILPPHQVTDNIKLASMIDLLRDGGELPPVLLYGDQSYSGSHRIAAWTELNMDIDYIEIDDDQYTQIMRSLSLDPIYDDISDFEIFMEEAIELGFAQNAK